MEQKLNNPCPVCHSPSSRIFQKGEYWICECQGCHHRFADITTSSDHTHQIYQDNYFNGDAAGYPDYLSEEKILTNHGRQYSNLLKKFTVPGNLLDVGSAAGFIMKGFQDGGWRSIGLEPNLSMAEYGRNHLGVQIDCTSLEYYSPNQQFDLVSMIQVIPHFFDIRLAFQKASDATKPGGLWLIETWDKESWVAHLFGKYWHEYSPPSVLHWFSPAGLNLLANQYGFSEVARGHPLKRISGSHAKSLLDHTLNNTPLDWLRAGLKIVPDQLVIPYPSFDLFWMVLQKNNY
jgi:SAM-dependent methyltransferase